MYALYARQSIDKQDSISIESQLELCRYETRGQPYKEYIDKGYSGKNTERPEFQKMLSDIKNGLITHIVVYKLDRISRSVLDFTTMIELFQKLHVEFISHTEKFDTSTPMGRAMLNICIVFAQLERETIQRRVTDAYYSRSKRGFYMGGKTPYGFQLEHTVIDGIQTSKYKQVAEESEQIKLIYALYSDSSNSLGDIVDYLNKHHIAQLRGGMWSATRISELLRNPVYVQADADVYNFYVSQGANLMNPITDYVGKNGCYLYSGMQNAKDKRRTLTGKEVVLAPHEGIVTSDVWLRCRIRCLNNRQSTKTCKAKNSWLLGKVKCGNCGYGLNIVKANTKMGRYFVCGTKLASKGAKCHGTGSTIYADALEAYMLSAIKDRLRTFANLGECKHSEVQPRMNQIKIEMQQLDEKIQALVSKVANANETLMQYINTQIETLHTKKLELSQELVNISTSITKEELHNISNHTQQWETISFEDKQAVVDALIQVIRIAGNKINIVWRV
ncbi:MAG: recombinase family protein [Ruminococcus sp.]|jgi:DNA invertase Pin-like site-specific DNA recombinase|nr:recombinase family protein [Ruminococcus sp.]